MKGPWKVSSGTIRSWRQSRSINQSHVCCDSFLSLPEVQQENQVPAIRVSGPFGSLGGVNGDLTSPLTQIRLMCLSLRILMRIICLLTCSVSLGNKWFLLQDYFCLWNTLHSGDEKELSSPLDLSFIGLQSWIFTCCFSSFKPGSVQYLVHEEFLPPQLCLSSASSHLPLASWLPLWLMASSSGHLVRTFSRHSHGFALFPFGLSQTCSDGFLVMRLFL